LSNLLTFSEYNENWPIEFEKIKTYLDALLINLHIDIHHVGSTSVVGLGAKPIIDIDIEYDANFDQIKSVLENNGYIFRGDLGIKDRFSFKYITTNFYTHHLYVTHTECLELKRHIDFRNALRMSKLFRTEYHDLKKFLIKQNNHDRDLYLQSKTNLIEHILKECVTMKSIVFAGGCFWGVEAYFQQINGVTETEVGYINGDGKTTYKEVCEGAGHAEAVYMVYDEKVVSLKKLLDHLFNIIDPTSVNKQGPDIGVQYRSGIYNYVPEDLNLIKNYISVRQKEYKRPIALELATNLEFFSAEDYHQDYLKKNKNGYCHVNLGSYKNVE